MFLRNTPGEYPVSPNSITSSPINRWFRNNFTASYLYLGCQNLWQQSMTDIHFHQVDHLSVLQLNSHVVDQIRVLDNFYNNTSLFQVWTFLFLNIRILTYPHGKFHMLLPYENVKSASSYAKSDSSSVLSDSLKNIAPDLLCNTVINRWHIPNSVPRYRLDYNTRRKETRSRQMYFWDAIPKNLFEK